MVLLSLGLYYSCSLAYDTKVPNLIVKQFRGDSVQLQDIAKDKVTFVSVWSVFCGPCLKEMPMLHRLFDKFKGKSHFAFVAIALNTSNELEHFVSGNDSVIFFSQLLKSSKLKQYNLPTVIALKRESKVIKFGDGSMGVGNSQQEMATWKKMFGFEAIPFIIIYNRKGEVAYQTDYSIDTETMPEKYEKLLNQKTDSLLRDQ